VQLLSNLREITQILFCILFLILMSESLKSKMDKALVIRKIKKLRNYNLSWEEKNLLNSLEKALNPDYLKVNNVELNALIKDKKIQKVTNNRMC